MYSYLSLLSAIIVYASLTIHAVSTANSLQNICPTMVVETKNGTCPNGTSFNIITEYEKPEGEWRIDFTELRVQGLNTPDQVINYIAQRSASGSPCIYQRKVSKDICCKGWGGTSCNEPICTIACVNGQCTAPYTCSCTAGYAGEGCQYSLSDPRLVQCYRESLCLNTSMISSELMSISYCCGSKSGTATKTVGGTCSLCTDTVAETTNVTLPLQPTLNYATCVLWGRDHIRTFDGFIYDFQGACQYKLTSTNNWEIDIQTDNCDRWETCKKTLSITLGGFRVVA
ncbi:unnamed protein product, partial [Rotaria magnacalcarata]